MRYPGEDLEIREKSMRSGYHLTLNAKPVPISFPTRTCSILTSKYFILPTVPIGPADPMGRALT